MKKFKWKKRFKQLKAVASVASKKKQKHWEIVSQFTLNFYYQTNKNSSDVILYYEKKINISTILLVVIKNPLNQFFSFFCSLSLGCLLGC